MRRSKEVTSCPTAIAHRIELERLIHHVLVRVKARTLVVKLVHHRSRERVLLLLLLLLKHVGILAIETLRLKPLSLGRLHLHLNIDVLVLVHDNWGLLLLLCLL